MRIGFDLDKILINTPPLIPEIIIERLYGVKTNGILKYRFPSKLEQLVRILSHYHLFRPGNKRNLEFLRSLTQSKYELYLVSSRFGFLKQMTAKIVKKHGLEKIFDELHFNYDNEQPHVFKNNLIKKLKIDKYVDDDLYLLKFIASRNNKTKLYWFNKKLDKKISNNILAIKDISKILD